VDRRGDLDKRTREVLVGWEDNETRKDLLTLSGQHTRALDRAERQNAELIELLPGPV
jgi:hypothetical protein